VREKRTIGAHLSPEGISLDPITARPTAYHDASRKPQVVSTVLVGGAAGKPEPPFFVTPQEVERLKEERSFKLLHPDQAVASIGFPYGNYKKDGNGNTLTLKPNSFHAMTPRSSIRDSENLRKKAQNRIALTFAALALVAGAGVVGYLSSTLWMRNRTVNPYGYGGYGGYGGW
jgi:hypothetical protein